MQQRAGEALSREQEHADEHIGDLADSGVGQALFEDLLPISHHGAHEYRQHGKAQKRILHPGPPQGAGADHKIQNADDAQHTRLGNDGGEHCAGRRRSNRMGRGQPTVEGIHTCFGAEADDRNEHRDAEHFHMPRQDHR